LRVVVNISTKRQTVERMVREILRLGRECSEASATPGILRTQRADSIPEASTRPTELKSCTEQHGLKPSGRDISVERGLKLAELTQNRSYFETNTDPWSLRWVAHYLQVLSGRVGT
jgi:hypothetical protein